MKNNIYLRNQLTISHKDSFSRKCNIGPNETILEGRLDSFTVANITLSCLDFTFVLLFARV